MKPLVALQSPVNPDVSIRSIIESDIEILRQWKNDHRGFFFFQSLISPEAQKVWFNDFQKRKNDHMFIVEVAGDPVGCLGYRLLENGEADIYNVILGNKRFENKGVMTQALQLMTRHITEITSAKIGLKVLKKNPAVEWYKKNNFQIVAEHAEHYDLKI